ncbi:MAG: PorP/SprF family type IX secretion system membrane protein [Fulvivirga sp.]|uniref:PorP/SprF family type IX secretion system membrane protein n=1 Tax=Fulvivirga sp. TaxID=1931237 RepID=UPI0032EF3163
MRQYEIVFLFLYLFATVDTHAQYFQYSQYNYSSQRVNPGAISLSDYATASFVYRSQKSASDIALNSAFFEAKYPFIKRNGGDRWSSIGLSLMNDKIGLGGLFHSQEIGVSYALNFKSGDNSTISFGNRVNYSTRNVNTSNLVTENQFILDFGFDPSLPSGENLGAYNTNVISFSSGVVMESIDRDENRKMHIGLSAFNINQPDESFLGSRSPLPITTIIEAGYRIYENQMVSLYPEMLYTLTAGTASLNAGLVTHFKLDRYDSRLSGQSIQLHTKYLSNQGAMIGVQWHRGPLSIGSSFDIPLNNRLANRGAFEIGFQFGKLIQTKYKARKVRRKRLRRNKTSNDRSNDGSRTDARDSNKGNITELEDQLKNEEEVNQDQASIVDNVKTFNKTDSGQLSDDSVKLESEVDFGDLKHIQPEKPVFVNFSFELNEAELDDADKSRLNDLIITLKSNETYSVEIIGHTDDIGSSEYNLKLSKDRAKAIARYLMSQGIERSRMKVEGYGEEKPLKPNTSDENRAYNRRVEFILHKSKTQINDH